MNRARVIGATLMFLVVGGGATARAQDRHDRGDHGDHDRGGQVPPEEQRARVQAEQQRASMYQQHLNESLRQAQEQTARLQQQQRAAQYQAQQDYYRRLAEQQERLRVSRDYTTEPYVVTPHTFRYYVGNTYHMTNQYGADALRQAVNYGYQEGFQAGRADHLDRWAPNF